MHQPIISYTNKHSRPADIYSQLITRCTFYFKIIFCRGSIESDSKLKNGKVVNTKTAAAMKTCRCHFMSHTGFTIVSSHKFYHIYDQQLIKSHCNMQHQPAFYAMQFFLSFPPLCLFATCVHTAVCLRCKVPF